MNRMKNKSGFTLIEVLISILVLSFGLLGLAGLQALGLKNNVSAYHRGQATQLAYDMADRIRANIEEAKKSNTSIYNTLAASSANVQNSCKAAPGCTTSELAQNDLYEWNESIKILPSGSGQINLADQSVTIKPAGATPAVKTKVTVCTIIITWDDDRNGIDTNDPNFKMSFQVWSDS